VLQKRVPKAVAVAAHIARVWLVEESPADEDILFLLAAANEKKTASGLPWGDGELNWLCHEVAMWAIDRRLPTDRLLALLEKAGPQVGQRVAGTLIKSAFPDGCRADDPESLTSFQRVTLTLAVEYKVKMHGYLGNILKKAGVPLGDRAILAYLGLGPAGAFDQLVDWDGRATAVWRLIRAAIHDTMALDDLVGLLQSNLDAPALLTGLAETFDETYHWADIMPTVAGVQKVHDEGPFVQRPHARSAEVLAAVVRGLPEASVRTFAEARLGALLEAKHPSARKVVLWTLVLARLGPLESRWHPAVDKLLNTSPSNRAPRLINEILSAVSKAYMTSVVPTLPLVRWGGSTHKQGGEVVFTWKAVYAGEGWWFLPGCPTAGGIAAFLEAIHIWSNLPPAPENPPRGIHVTPHGPFPLMRAHEFVAACDSAEIRSALEALLDDDEYDRTLVEQLLTEMGGG